MTDARVADAYIELRYKLDQLSKDLQKAQSTVDDQMDRVAKSAQSRLGRIGSAISAPFKKLGGAMSTVQGQLGGLAASAGTGAIFGNIVSAAGDFESAMNRVSAVANATDAQFLKLKETAKELGATTQFSASEAADGMKFLAQAGFNADEVVDAISGTLQLASAASIGLGEAADIASNVLTGYGKSVEELGAVNDVLVKSFTSANTNLQQLGEAFKYAGPVSAGFKQDFEETAAVLSILGNAGFQASMAGTALRGALTRLASPTAPIASAIENLGLSLEEVNPATRSFTDILASLEEAGLTAGDAMTIFGQRAGPAVLSLLEQGSGAIRELQGDLENSGGTAQRIADTQMKGFNGAMKELASAAEALKIAIGESGLLEALTEFVKWAAEMVRSLSQSNPQLLKFTGIAAGIAAALAPALTALGLLSLAIGAIGAPIGLAIAAIVAIGAVIIGFKDEIADLIDNGIDLLKSAFADLPGTVSAAAGSVGDAFSTMGSMALESLRSISPGMADVVEQVMGFAGQIVQAYVNMGSKAVEAVEAMVTSIKDWLGDKLMSIIPSVDGAIDAVESKFAWLWDKVVGHSWVPDMVEDVGHHMSRLSEEMIPPTDAAVSAVSDKFKWLGEELAKPIVGGGMKVDGGGFTGLPAMPKMPFMGDYASMGQGGDFSKLTEPAKDALDDLSESAQRTANLMQNAGQSAISTLEQGFVDLALSGKANFKDMIDTILDDLARLAIRAAIFAPLQGAFASAFGGGAAAGGGGGFFSGLFENQYGGEYRVGGSGGIDSQLAMMKVSPGELIKVTPRGEEAIRSGPVNNVNIHNHAGEQVSQTSRRNNSGGMDLDVIIGPAINKLLSTGGLDSGMRSRFNLAPGAQT